MPKFDKTWARQETQSVTGKLREAVKPQGALKPRIQTAVNKLQVQISKMDSMLTKLHERDAQLFQRVVTAMQQHDTSTSRVKRKILKSEKFPIYRYTTIISGAKISRDIVHRPDIAAILAYKDGHILVVSHNRFPNQTDIEIPSGNMEKNEKPIACAFREFEEETGYQSKKMIPFFSFYTSIGYSTQRVHCFIAKDFEKNGKQNLDDDEMLQVKKIQFKKLLKMALNGKIIDSITLSSVLLFAIKKKLI